MKARDNNSQFDSGPFESGAAMVDWRMKSIAVRANRNGYSDIPPSANHLRRAPWVCESARLA